MKMPTESSIYWDSVGSQHSISIGSSGDGCSSASTSRHYVDPWDLENYAYLRRHSMAGVAQQVPPRHHRRSAYRLSQDARAHSEYWWVVIFITTWRVALMGFLASFLVVLAIEIERSSGTIFKNRSMQI